MLKIVSNSLTKWSLNSEYNSAKFSSCSARKLLVFWNKLRVFCIRWLMLVLMSPHDGVLDDVVGKAVLNPADLGREVLVSSP